MDLCANENGQKVFQPIEIRPVSIIIEKFIWTIQCSYFVFEFHLDEDVK